MAKRNPELDERRELIARMVSNAGRKVSRLKAKGVSLAGTEHDVRRDPAKVSKYNMAQLNAYEKQLHGFSERRNSFYAGANDTIITGDAWREYKHVEKLANARGKRWDDNVGGVFIKQSGMTVQERKDFVKSKRVRAAGESTPRLYVHNDRKPENVNGMKAVQKLIKQQKDRLKKDYVHQEVKKGRAAFNSMLNQMGNLGLVAKLNELTDHQFAILVKETNFADEVGLKYTSLQQMAKEDAGSGSHARYLDSVVDSSSGIISDYLQTAKAYPARPTKKVQSTKKSSS